LIHTQKQRHTAGAVFFVLSLFAAKRKERLRVAHTQNSLVLSVLVFFFILFLERVTTSYYFLHGVQDWQQVVARQEFAFSDP
jgi:hypothetical protein